MYHLRIAVPSLSQARLALPCRILARCLGSLLTATMLLSATPATQAAVFGEGDITPSKSDFDFQGNPIEIPDLPDEGGDLEDDIVIGGTGMHVSNTNFGKLSITNPLFTNPFSVISATIGLESTGAGLATVTGFTSAWLIRGGDLIVGAGGYGELQIEAGGLVSIAEELDDQGEPTGTIGDTIIGQDFTSQGVLSLDGFASSFISADTFIGQFGTADIIASDRATMWTTEVIVGEEVGSSGTIRLSDSGTRWFNTGDLLLGDLGHAVLEINSEAIASFGELDSTPIEAEEFVDGTTEIGTLGRIELAGGRLLTYDLINAGLIRGNGWLQPTNSFVIEPSGEIRNAATTANLREYIYISGPVDNSGIIESLGGEMEFESEVISTGDIIARDAIFRFQDGLISDDIVFGGATTMYGHITSLGKTLVLPDSTSVIVGSFTLAPSSVTDLSIGASFSSLDILGSAAVDGLLLLDYSAGIASQAGDSYQILTASDGISGMFSNNNNTAVADGRLWDIAYDWNTVIVTAAGLTGDPNGADFNGDNFVDGEDLLIWQAHFPITSSATGGMGDADGDFDVDGNDFMIWQLQVGGSPPPPALAATATVPEPAAWMMLVFGSILLTGAAYRPRRMSPVRARR